MKGITSKILKRLNESDAASVNQEGNGSEVVTVPLGDLPKSLPQLAIPYQILFNHSPGVPIEKGYAIWHNEMNLIAQFTKNNSFTTNTLNMTVEEFNEKYEGQYIIKEDKSYLTEGFWTVYDTKEKECGVFKLSDTRNTLMETSYSQKNYNFTENLQQQSLQIR